MHIDALRFTTEMSDGESLDDTIRTASGMLDMLVMRTPFQLERDVVAAQARCPVINAGDGLGGHPTQALIDVFAMERLRGPIRDLRIGILGDASTRVASSLFALLTRLEPVEIRVMTPAERSLPAALRRPGYTRAITITEETPLDGLDVVYLTGFPALEGPFAMDAQRRHQYQLDPARISTLPAEAIVLSPLPVIDEIERSVRDDPRVLMFEASDLSIYVRQAVLGFLRTVNQS